MAYLVPETAKRLQATAIVSNIELEATSGANILRCAAEQTARSAVQKLLDDCTKVDSYCGYAKMIRLDVFVLSPEEFYAALAEARAQGERDALQWGRP